MIGRLGSNLTTILLITLYFVAPTKADEIRDDLGETLSFSSVPMRVISLAPSNTEMLFALGLGDRIVGVTEYCNYPPEANSIIKWQALTRSIWKGSSGKARVDISHPRK